MSEFKCVYAGPEYFGAKTRCANHRADDLEEIRNSLKETMGDRFVSARTAEHNSYSNPTVKLEVVFRNTSFDDACAALSTIVRNIPIYRHENNESAQGAGAAPQIYYKNKDTWLALEDCDFVDVVLL